MQGECKFLLIISPDSCQMNVCCHWQATTESGSRPTTLECRENVNFCLLSPLTHESCLYIEGGSELLDDYHPLLFVNYLRVPMSSGNYGKPGKLQKKVPCMEKSWNLKKMNNHGKIMDFLK